LLKFLLKVTKELKSLNKKIVECTWDATSKQWKFLRVREDKSFPNGYNTAMSTSVMLKIFAEPTFARIPTETKANRQTAIYIKTTSAKTTSYEIEDKFATSILYGENGYKLSAQLFLELFG